MRSHLYLQLTRRNQASAATDGDAILLKSQDYSYSSDSKWGPNEVKEFLVSAPIDLQKETFGGATLINAMDVPGSSDLDVEWVQIRGEDQTGQKWWWVADHKTAGTRHWLRNNLGTGDYPGLPIPTMDWKEATSPLKR